MVHVVHDPPACRGVEGAVPAHGDAAGAGVATRTLATAMWGGGGRDGNRVRRRVLLLHARCA
jgi:hypothetical protein